MPKEVVRFDGDKNIIFRVVGKGTLYTDPLSSFTQYIYIDENTDKEYALKDDGNLRKIYNASKKSADKDLQAKHIKVLSSYFFDNFLVLPIGETRSTFFLGKKIKDIDIDSRFSSVDFDKVIAVE